MRRPIASQIVGFLVLALLVGLALEWIGLTPLGFWEAAGDRVLATFEWLWVRADGLILTIAAGAIVIAPIYAVRWLLSRRR